MRKEEYVTDVTANVALDLELDRLNRAKAKFEAKRPIDE
jgi:hypothetical protein